MKQQTLIFTAILFIAFIAFAAGCKDRQDSAAGSAGISINSISKDTAYAALFNYGVFAGKSGFKPDSVTMAWLINGADFLLAMGIDSATASGILQNAKHQSIHAYIGIPPSNNVSGRLNLQLYLVGSDMKINQGDTTISDHDASGIYNLTLPCPSACSSSAAGDTSLTKSFLGGYLIGTLIHDSAEIKSASKEIK